VGGHSGIFRSNDDGASWEKVHEARSLLGLLKGSGGVLRAYGNDTMAYSTDGGATWSRITIPKSRSSVMPAVDSNGVIYSAASDRKTGRVHLARSADNGISWSDIQLPGFIGEPFLHADGDGVLFLRSTTSDFVSTDRGESWGEGLPSGRVGLNRGMLIPARGVLVSAGYWGQLAKREYMGDITISHDGGRTWRRSAQPFGVEEIALTMTADSLGRLYVVTSSGAIYRSNGSVFDTATVEESFAVAGWRPPGLDSAALRKALAFPTQEASRMPGARMTLAVLVDARGKPSKIETYGGDQAYDQIVSAAARRIGYTPGLRDGAPVAGWVMATIRFGSEIRSGRRMSDTIILVQVDGTGAGLWMKPGTAPDPVAPKSGKGDLFIPAEKEPTWDSVQLERNVRYSCFMLPIRSEGRVNVAALINADGSIAQAAVVGSGVDRLNAAAVEAVRRTPFKPATFQGKGVTAWAYVPVSFKFPPNGKSSSVTADTAALRRLLVYPPSELRNGTGGQVDMMLRIDTAGRIDAYDGNGPAPFVAAVKKALGRVRGTPGLCYGLPYEDSLLLIVDFEAVKGSAKKSITIRLSTGWNGTGGGLGIGIPAEIVPQIMVKEVEPDIDEFVATKEPEYDPAELRRNVVYPEIAKSNGIEGKVVVRALIDTNGEVKKWMIDMSDNKLFEQAAIDAVKKTRFKPAMQGQERMAAWITIPISFKLGD
jgi:TonB family protein